MNENTVRLRRRTWWGLVGGQAERWDHGGDEPEGLIHQDGALMLPEDWEILRRE